jgi:AraC-like DNA-binding protein
MGDQGRLLDQFLNNVEIRVEAFAVCEIDRHVSLRCDPFDSVVVHFVLGGEGFLECKHGRFPLREGTAVVVPKKLPKTLSGAGPIEHVRRAKADCSLGEELLTFRASDGQPGLVLGCAELSGTIGAELPLFDQAKRPIIEHSDHPLVRQLFAVMAEEMRDPGVGTRTFVGALMKQVLIAFLRTQPNDDSSILLMSGVRLAGVVAAILERPEDNHTVDSLAAIAGMSRARFNHHFVLAYNLTPRAFVQAARLASAARMLRASAVPIKSIAASVGYASRSHFSRAFQAKFGLDPSAFRGTSAAKPNRLPAPPLKIAARQ